MCGVKQAIGDGSISERRYQSYIRMLRMVVPIVH
jgi:putative ribosome biogenesis GTPase RsgA